MSNKISITRFYRVGVATLSRDDRTFGEAFENDKIANEYYFAVCDNEGIIITYHRDVGVLGFKTKNIEDAVNELLKCKFQGGYPVSIVKPILLAAIENKIGYLTDTFDSSEFKLYLAQEWDDAINYKSKIEGLSTVFGIGSVRYDSDDTFFNLDNNKIEYEDLSLDNLAELYRYVGGDVTVAVVRPYQELVEENVQDNFSIDLNQDESQFSCSECGEVLAVNSKFCSNCGAKIEIKVRPHLEPHYDDSCSNLTPLKVLVNSVEVKKPEDEDDYAVTVSYSIENNTEFDFELLNSNVALLNSEGVLIEERQISEELLTSGQSSIADIQFWGIPKELLGNNPSGLGALIQIKAYRGEKVHLATVEMPNQSNSIVELPELNWEKGIKITGGSVWFGTDSDQETYLYSKLTVLNQTENYFPEIRMIANLVTNEGDAISNIAGLELNPNALMVLSSGAYSNNEESLKKSKLVCEVMNLEPIAQGFTSYFG